ncbi:MAG: hypothetical protein D6694_10125, partial [Gammaproteobacteria bacterium]
NKASPHRTPTRSERGVAVALLRFGEPLTTRGARMRHRGTGVTVRAGDEFSALALYGRRRLREKRVIYGHAVYVVAAREADEPWIVVTNERP